MRSTIPWVLFLSGCPASSPAPVASFPTWRVEQVIEAAVAIRRADRGRAHCAGVYTGDVVITAAHCMDPELLVATERDLAKEVWSPYGCRFMDEAQDIAVLEPLSSEIRRHGALAIAPYEPARGQVVAATGHPLGLWFSWSVGEIAHPRRVEEDNTVWIQSTTPIYFGNSGGPLVDQQGMILGIASAIADGVSTLGLWVHKDAILDALEAEGGCP